MKELTKRVSLIATIFLLANTLTYGQEIRPGDYFKNFNFRIEIEGVSNGAVSEILGFSSESEVIHFENSDETRVRKGPGSTYYGNIIIRRGLTTDASWWNWREQIVDGSEERRAGSIILLDRSRNEIMRWNFFEAWPAAYRLLPFEADGNDILIEELELAVELIERG